VRSRTRSQAASEVEGVRLLGGEIEDEVTGGVRFSYSCSTVCSLGSDEAEDGAPAVGEVVAGGDSRGRGSGEWGRDRDREGAPAGIGECLNGDGEKKMVGIWLSPRLPLAIAHL
jgi:hypothetical protein